MHFGIAQILILGLLILSLGISLAKHGEPKNGKENFFITLLGVALQITLLYFGGFFK
jgi:hypothetical protein